MNGGRGMSDRSTRGEKSAEGAGETVAEWAGAPQGVVERMKSGARRAFPDHWSFLLGEICLYSFVILIVTGVYLSLHFHPSAAMVQYQGSYGPLRGHMVSEAFNSAMKISFDVRGGLLVRQAHHWAALIFVGSVLVHMLRTFFTGAFRKPRRLGWLIGFLLLILAMFEGLTGYDLPDDLLSGTGLAVVNGTILSIPVVGTYISMYLFGGEFPGNEVISRFNTLHVLIIPAFMLALMAAYFVLARRNKHAQYPGPGRTNKNVVGIPLKVRAVKSAGFFSWFPEPSSPLLRSPRSTRSGSTVPSGRTRSRPGPSRTGIWVWLTGFCGSCPVGRSISGVTPWRWTIWSHSWWPAACSWRWPPTRSSSPG